MPASIPNVDTKFPGLPAYKFPQPVATENSGPIEPTS
jgi:hypothetical protein